jgi:hypothetical protein
MTGSPLASISAVATTARLYLDPGDLLPGMIRENAPEVLGDVGRNDNISIDGRWWRVVSAAKTNDAVEIRYVSPALDVPDPLLG